MPGPTQVQPVGGRTVAVAASFARPADTTAYAANDAVSDSTSAPTLLTFTGAVRYNGASGYVTKARVVTDQSTCTAQLRLWLYSTDSGVTPTNDNAAHTVTYANRTKRLGYIDLPALATEGSGSDCAIAQADTIRLAVIASGSANLYGRLETKGAFTPASAQNWWLEIVVEQN